MDYLQYVVFVMMLFGLTACAFVWTRATFVVVIAFAALVAVGVLDAPNQASPLGTSALRADPDSAPPGAAMTCHYRALDALTSQDHKAVSAALRACRRRR